MTTLLDIANHFAKPETCLEHLTQLRWGGHVTCIHCKHDKVYALKGKTKRFKCAKCRKQFSAIKGTIFESSPIPLQKWFIAFFVLTSHKKGISSIQLSKDIGVTQRTAWFMMQRIRYILDTGNIEPPKDGKESNIYEIDETYCGGSMFNKHRPTAARIRRKFGHKLRGRATIKEPVLGIVQRGGKISLTHVPDAKKLTIMPIIEKHVPQGATIYTDEFKIYTHLSYKYNHATIQHRLDEYVNGDIHTQTIEGSFGLLKNGFRGVQHHVSPKHLQRYLDEFSFKYSSRNMKDVERFTLAMSHVEGRLTYNQLVRK